MFISRLSMSLKDAAKRGQEPAIILRDSALSEEQKLKALKELEIDQKALLRADDENMSRDYSDHAQMPCEAIMTIQRAERRINP